MRIEFPFDDDDKLKTIADGFQESTSNHPALYGCVGALDGYAVRIRRPSLHEVANPLDYVNRKGFFSLNMQAICDAKCRFLFISIETPGSTHDASAFALSSFCERWSAQCGSKAWYIAADAAYPISENIVTPWQGRNLDPFEDSFNFHFSGGNRNVIERAFGLLVRRWGILSKKIEFPLHRVPQIVVTCASLHNFLINSHRDLPSEQAKRPAAYQNLGWTSFRLGMSKATGIRRRPGREVCQRRVEMTSALRAAGRLRPAPVPRSVESRRSN